MALSKPASAPAPCKNGSVGLDPFHDRDSKIPSDLKARVQKASDRIKDGSIKIDLGE